MKRRNFVLNSSLGLAGIMAGNQLSGQLPFFNPIPDGLPKNSREKLLDNWQLFALEENGELNKAELNSLPAQNTKVYSCSIPAQVHDVLTEKGVIEDPIHFEAQEPCLWVAEKDWVYQTQFAGVDARKVVLHFKGLDTIADIYLNGEKIFTNKSCFLPARIDVTGKLEDENKLLIYFYAPRSWLEKNEKAQAFVDEGGDLLRYIRKQREDFNFFNGPKPSFTPVGIYDEVVLEAIDDAELQWVDIEQSVAEDLKSAIVSIQPHVANYSGKKISFETILTNPEGKVISSASENKIRINFPELWYPRGYGKQPLYKLETKLLVDGEWVETDVKQIGLRKLELNEKFDLVINNKKVKIWGSNITQLPNASHVWDSELFKTTIDLAEMGNNIALRAWGPSHPWNEQLFAEADKRGILVWSEFAHTGGPFPDDPEFIGLCIQEAENWVKSWKHHPSLLLWCGGNEALLGIGGHDVPELEINNQKLFEEKYRSVCETLDPNRLYVPNSPFGGDFKNDPKAGDSHIRSYDWFMPGMDYPVLPSENTRTTIALKKTLQHHLGNDLRWPEGGFRGIRTKNSDNVLPPSWSGLIVANSWVANRLGEVGRLYEADGTPDSLLFRIGAGCSKYIRNCIERYRRGKPFWNAGGERRTRGHFWWKLNDTFPLIYSSLVDDLLEPNMSFYALKRAYQPVLVSIETTDSVNIWVVNDSPEDIKGRLSVKLLNANGTRSEKELKTDVFVEQGDSKLAANLDEFELFNNKLPIVAELYSNNGQLLGQSLEYICAENHISFPEAEIKMEWKNDELWLTTDKIARWVELKGNNNGDEFGWYFGDNFFDLIPDRIKKVKITGKHRTGLVTAKSYYSDKTTGVELV